MKACPRRKALGFPGRDEPIGDIAVEVKKTHARNGVTRKALFLPDGVKECLGSKDSLFLKRVL
jgi:hypothetical protein